MDPLSQTHVPNVLQKALPFALSHPGAISTSHALHKREAVASEATEETSRLLMTDECDGSSSLNRENGYAKLKRNKNKVNVL